MPRSRKRYAKSVPNEVRSTIGPEDWLEKALADPAFDKGVPHTVRTETVRGQYTLDPDESLIERRKLAFRRERHAVLIASTWGVNESGEEEAEDD